MNHYAARCIFLHEVGTYEERITMWLAPDEETAIHLAESEADEHAAMLGFTNLGIVQLYSIADHVTDQGCEVFSLIRDSPLEPTQYVDSFFSTGTEYQRIVAEE